MSDFLGIKFEVRSHGLISQPPRFVFRATYLYSERAISVSGRVDYPVDRKRPAQTGESSQCRPLVIVKGIRGGLDVCIGR